MTTNRSVFKIGKRYVADPEQMGRINSISLYNYEEENHSTTPIGYINCGRDYFVILSASPIDPDEVYAARDEEFLVQVLTSTGILGWRHMTRRLYKELDEETR